MCMYNIIVVRYERHSSAQGILIAYTNIVGSGNKLYGTFRIIKHTMYNTTNLYYIFVLYNTHL